MLFQKAGMLGPDMTPLCRKGGMLITLFILAGYVDYTEERVDDVQEVFLVSVLKAPPDEEDSEDLPDGDPTQTMGNAFILPKITWDPGNPSVGQELMTLCQKAGVMMMLCQKAGVMITLVLKIGRARTEKEETPLFQMDGKLLDSKTVHGERYWTEVAGAEGGCYEVSHGGGLGEEPVLAEEWEAMAPHKESYRYHQFGMSNTPVSKASVSVGDVTSATVVECSCNTKKGASGKMLLTRPWDPGEAEIDAAKVYEWFKIWRDTYVPGLLYQPKWFSEDLVEVRDVAVDSQEEDDNGRELFNSAEVEVERAPRV